LKHKLCVRSLCSASRQDRCRGWPALMNQLINCSIALIVAHECGTHFSPSTLTYIKHFCIICFPFTVSFVRLTFEMIAVFFWHEGICRGIVRSTPFTWTKLWRQVILTVAFERPHHFPDLAGAAFWCSCSQWVLHHGVRSIIGSFEPDVPSAFGTLDSAVLFSNNRVLIWYRRPNSKILEWDEGHVWPSFLIATLSCLKAAAFSH